MRVLFVYFNKDFRPRTSLTISLLETIIRQDGHQTKVFDTSFYPQFSSGYEKVMTKAGIYKPVSNLDIPVKLSNPHDDLRRAILEFKPNLLAFSYYSFNEDVQRELLGKVKAEFPELKIIAGGPAVCINPLKSFKEPYIDLACFGEGEIAFKELCNRIRDEKDINGIPGIWIRAGDKVLQNGIAPLADLNKLPVQEWESFDPIHINGFFNGKAYRMGHVEFIRGCPYNCTYCGSGSIKKPYFDAGVKGYIRHKDPKTAVAEFKALRDKYQLEMFYFVAGTFTAIPTNVLEELARLYKEEVGVPFFALVRPETIKERTAQLLAEMGCVHVSIGVESGVREYREKILNRKMSDEQIVSAIKYLRANGISVSAYNMIGLPGMDREHVFKTIELNRRANPNNAILSVFMPFDNEFTHSLIDRGIIKEKDIKVMNGTEPSIEIDDMSKEEIMGLYNTFNLYIKMPKWTYAFIRLLEKENVITRFIRKQLYKVIRS